MKKALLFLTMLAAFSAISVSAQSKVKVTFAKNQWEKKISGIVRGTKYIDYVFRVKQYYFIEANLESAAKNVKFTVFKTNGKAFPDGVGVREFSNEAEKTGEYKIRVYNLDAAPGAKFRLRISAYIGT